MTKGTEISNTRYCMNYTGFKYHPADNNGVMYLCDCCAGFRVSGKIKYGLGRKFRSDERRNSMYVNTKTILLHNLYKNSSIVEEE